VPALNRVKRFAKDVKQKAQFHSIDVALELFETEFDGYPNSDERDENNTPYCGAMKLCEAMMGQDLLGFHPDSHFNDDDGTGQDELYPDNAPSTPYPAWYTDNLKARRGPYLQLDNANAYKLKDIYADTKPFNKEKFVLCDVYKRVTNKFTGKKIGMPILYYKADTSKNSHDPNDPKNEDNIYDYKDNHELLALGMPWIPPSMGSVHKLLRDSAAGEGPGYRFYLNTKNDSITGTSRPCRSDSYVLISAGFDGEYGTPDDICNFKWTYK